MSVPELAVAPSLRHLYRASFTIGRSVVLGSGAAGMRLMVPITGGRFEGEQLAGEVLPGGADWQLIRPDGVVEIDARYTMRSDDGALIAVHNVGIFHGPPEVMRQLLLREYPSPALYYMRTRPTFQTSSPAYAWLERLVAVAAGEVRAEGLLLQVHAVE